VRASPAVIQGCFPHGVRATGGPRRLAYTVHIPTSPVTRSTGLPLQPAVCQRMEAAFRTTFRDVRVHVGPHVSALGARAYTQGSQIHFAPGQYNAASPQGRYALALELAHVVQQRSGRVRNPFGSGVAIVRDPRLEREAESLAARAAASFAPVVQRHPGADNFLAAHVATDHLRLHDQLLHDWLATNAVDARAATVFGKVTITWGDLLKPEPDAAGYALPAQGGAIVGMETPVYRFGKPNARVDGEIHYRGVNALGQNLGVDAVITYQMSTKYKELLGDALGKSATGDYPYFRHSKGAPGVHRGHLLARCMGGEGDRHNWVPLSSSANVTTMWSLVERECYDWMEGRGHWLVLKIRPQYDGSVGPIPRRIFYQRTFHDMAGNIGRHDVRIILNDVSLDDFSFATRANWA